MTESVEELERELYESEVKSSALTEALAESNVSDLTELVSKGGKMRGHLVGLTSRQYEKITGSKPSPGQLVKARDATTKKVPWERVLDQIATERGYKTENELHAAIEKAHKDKQAIKAAGVTQKVLRSQIIDKMRAEPEVEKITLDDICPQFPDSVCAAEVTLVNGMRFRLRRQHSYWRLDTEDKSFKIRYAKDARKLAQVVTKHHQQKIKETRRAMLPGKKPPRITPKRPMLKR